MSEIKKIKEQYLSKLNEFLDQNKLNEIKTELFGKNGIISTKFKQLGLITEEKRKDYATELNLLKNELQELISKKTEEIQIFTCPRPQRLVCSFQIERFDHLG